MEHAESFHRHTGPQLLLSRWQSGSLTCDRCARPIRTGSGGLAQRDGRVFHAACSARDGLEARSGRTTASPAPAPRVIGALEGSALTFEEPRFLQKNGQHERYATGSLDAGIQFGGQMLLVDHVGPSLRGRFSTLGEDGRRLVFRFELDDGPRERGLLGLVQRGAVTGCSIGVRPDISAWQVATLVHERAHLDEVSILTSGQPGWLGTWCRAVP